MDASQHARDQEQKRADVEHAAGVCALSLAHGDDGLLVVCLRGIAAVALNRGCPLSHVLCDAAEGYSCACLAGNY